MTGYSNVQARHTMILKRLANAMRHYITEHLAQIYNQRIVHDKSLADQRFPRDMLI